MSVVAALEVVLAALIPPPMQWVVAYVAAVTALVGFAIGARRTGLLGKRSDGSIAPWSYALLAPWHLAVRGAARFVRAREPLSDEVHPGWRVGGWPNRPDLYDSWPAVLDLTAELPRTHAAEHYLCLPTWDGTAPTVTDISRGVQWVLAHRAAGRTVLIHCAAGHGRSVTVLVAALFAAGEHGSWRDAYAHVKTVRPTARLNSDQLAALSAWVKKRG